MRNLTVSVRYQSGDTSCTVTITDSGDHKDVDGDVVTTKMGPYFRKTYTLDADTYTVLAEIDTRSDTAPADLTTGDDSVVLNPS